MLIGVAVVWGARQALAGVHVFRPPVRKHGRLRAVSGRLRPPHKTGSLALGLPRAWPPAHPRSSQRQPPAPRPPAARKTQQIASRVGCDVEDQRATHNRFFAGTAKTRVMAACGRAMGCPCGAGPRWAAPLLPQSAHRAALGHRNAANGAGQGDEPEQDANGAAKDVERLHAWLQPQSAQHTTT